MPKPHERLEAYLEQRGWVDLEETINYCGYPRSWAVKEVGKAKTWVFGNPVKGNKKDWRRFLCNWLVRAWDREPDKTSHQEIEDRNTPYV